MLNSHVSTYFLCPVVKFCEEYCLFTPRTEFFSQVHDFSPQIALVSPILRFAGTELPERRPSDVRATFERRPSDVRATSERRSSDVRATFERRSGVCISLNGATSSPEGPQPPNFANTERFLAFSVFILQEVPGSGEFAAFGVFWKGFWRFCYVSKGKSGNQWCFEVDFCEFPVFLGKPAQLGTKNAEAGKTRAFFALIDGPQLPLQCSASLSWATIWVEFFVANTEDREIMAASQFFLVQSRESMRQSHLQLLSQTEQCRMKLLLVSPFCESCPP